ncbi:MAG TPA: glycoside hydrolase family 97 N-terminal domain-containing protein, partial [Myxococcota bacterium]|nr:glycoside hydrolase family 97 N-terminal domain-containing protein [Myxococcota bacterium]
MQISRPTGPSATPLSQPAVASRGAQASLAVSLPALPRARAVAPVETCSPDGRIRCVVRFSPSLAYSVIVDGRPVLAGGQLDLVTREYGGVGTPARPLGVSRRSVNRTVRPAQALWASAIPDRFEETSLRLTPTLSLEVRVANDGLALRFRGHADGPVTVTGETFTLPFNDAAEMRAMMPNALESPLAGDAYHDSYEHPFTRRRIGDVTSFRLAQMPAVFRCNDHWVGVSEAQVLGYPGSWMKRVPEGGFMLDAPGAPKRTKVTEALKFWRVETVTERHAHLVESNEGTRVYPWRVLQVGRSLADLVGRDFMARLADESIAAAAAEDFSWVPPHVTATDEWMIEAKPSLDPAKVGFTPGLNTPTYKYYVDFAARAGLSHIIVDDGWCDASDWTKRNPALDLEEVIRYGK